MPQIGWLEILVVVVLAILIIGPKDFPIVLQKVGSWISSFKNYFSQIQNDLSNIENSVENEISIEEDSLTNKKNKDKDE
jgi:sec-independent protein translocase protein TatB|tara:strand:+ start:104 stop:340 length:237 start_codon:yes stop_codon:yes gene_type:complete